MLDFWGGYFQAPEILAGSEDCDICETWSSESDSCKPKCADEDNPVCCPEGSDKEGQCIPLDENCNIDEDDDGGDDSGGNGDDGEPSPSDCGVCEEWDGDTCRPKCADEDTPVCCPEGSDKEGQCIALDESCND